MQAPPDQQPQDDQSQGSQQHAAAIAAINVSTVPTPNPDALMFRLDETLVPMGTYEYKDLALAADASPLAASLLQIQGVELILIAPRFVTVRKLDNARWPDVVPLIKVALREFVWSGEMAVFDTQVLQTDAHLDEVEQRILELLEEDIRPALAQDGGDVTYVGFQAGIVHLRMIGACGSCPSSTATLKMGIEALLMEEIPEVEGVAQV